MKLFSGMSGTDYQDVLRTIGALIDERGYRDVRIIETQDGMVVQGRVETNNTLGEAGYETYLVTDQDIKQMSQTAFERRRAKTA